METQKDLADILEKNQIVTMTLKACPNCVKVLEFIEKKGYAPKNIDAATSDGAALKKTAAEILKAEGVPLVFIKGRFVGGCDKTTSEGVFDTYMSKAPSTREEIERLLKIRK